MFIIIKFSDNISRAFSGEWSYSTTPRNIYRQYLIKPESSDGFIKFLKDYDFVETFDYTTEEF